MEKRAARIITKLHASKSRRVEEAVGAHEQLIGVRSDHGEQRKDHEQLRVLCDELQSRTPAASTGAGSRVRHGGREWSEGGV